MKIGYFGRFKIIMQNPKQFSKKPKQQKKINSGVFKAFDSFLVPKYWEFRIKFIGAGL